MYLLAASFMAEAVGLLLFESLITLVNGALVEPWNKAVLAAILSNLMVATIVGLLVDLSLKITPELINGPIIYMASPFLNTNSQHLITQ